jgi:heme A synthase
MAAGLSSEFADGAPALLRLRLLHPVAAIAAGVYLAWLGLRTSRANPNAASRRTGSLLAVLVAIQFAAGLADVWLLAPVWLQLVHLLLANLIWIVLVIAVIEDQSGERVAR